MFEFEGKQYARVTEVLQPFTDFGHIAPEVLARKCQIGTNVHSAINDVLHEKFPSIIEGIGYLLSFQKWWDRVKPTLVESETRYFREDKMITGQIDVLIKLPGQEDIILMDFKTSAQESPTWIMQGHLYRYLVIQKHHTISNRFLFLKLDKNGDMPKLFEYKFDLNIHAKCMKAIEDFWSTQEK